MPAVTEHNIVYNFFILCLYLIIILLVVRLISLFVLSFLFVVIPAWPGLLIFLKNGRSSLFSFPFESRESTAFYFKSFLLFLEDKVKIEP